MILDQWGKPIEGSYSTAISMVETSQDSGDRLPRPNLTQDIALLLSKQKHRMLLSDARHIAMRQPLVSGAVKQKADYVSQAGFLPVHSGSDKSWGAIARAKLKQAHKVSNVRGINYAWDRTWKIGCMTIDLEGDYFICWGRTKTGYPRYQVLEAHRIGCRNSERLVETGPFAGQKILNGIIYNSVGDEIGYRVLGSDMESDRDLSTSEMTHVCIPRWFSEGRPFPPIAYAILDWYDVTDTRGLQKQKQKIGSAITLVEKTPDGKMPVKGMEAALNTIRNGGTVTPKKSDLSANMSPEAVLLNGGLIRYIKNGMDVQMLQDNTPGDGWLRFDERIAQGAFYGMEWRAEMLDLSKLSGAPVRGFADQINTAIYSRWLDLTPLVYIGDMRLLSMLIECGEVPENPEWMEWGYIPPAEFVVDGGRSSKIDQDNVRGGFDTHTSIIGRFGRTPEEVLNEEADYLQLKAKIEADRGLAPGSLGRMDQPGMQNLIIGPDPNAPSS
jgi:hypothetical protein